jgi:carboxyl-terminal processing protease
MDRRLLLRAGLAAAVGSTMGGAAWAVEPDRDVTFAGDFDELWTTLRDRYCFFSEKRTDWDRVRTMYRPMAVQADSRDGFAAVVGQVMAELYDPHTSPADAPAGAQRGAISDIVVDEQNGRAQIKAILEDTAAAEADLRFGDLILAVDGQSLAPLIQTWTPKCLTSPDPTATAFALGRAVAGVRGQPRRYLIARGGEAAREIFIPIRPATPKPNVEWRRLEDGAGYIIIRSFADDAVTESFDQALAELGDAPGLILDVRNNGGGDTAVARPIMGRFITETKPYALMRRREGQGLSGYWTETVDPRGPFTYTRPVVVLADHWSASMAEGFPMGMRGIGRATVVGTPMMGLGAAVFPIVLDRTGLRAQYSAEPVYDVNRQPRWLMQPDVAVPDGQDILAAGRRTLAGLIG